LGLIVIKDKYPEFEIPDLDNNVICLTEDAWNHILDRRGAQWHNYWKYVKNTIENPDFVCEGNKQNNRVYIQERNKDRQKFESKYLVVIVNSNNDICTAWFCKKLSSFNNIREVNK